MKHASISLEKSLGKNEDCFLASEIEEGMCVALVADGVGGISGGGSASQCVVNAAIELIKDKIHAPLAILKRSHDLVNELPLEHAASTASIVLIRNNKLEFAHTGDSRIYVLRERGLLTLTTDQTEMNFLLSEGVLSKKAALNYKRKNVLMYAIEKGEELSPQIGSFQLLKGDRIILLTDGVYRLISKIQLRDMSLVYPDLDELIDSIKSEIAPRLIDDATIVAIEV